MIEETDAVDVRVWRDWRSWGLLTALSLGFGVIFMAQQYLSASLSGSRLPPAQNWWLNPPGYLVNVLFVPLVWLVCARFRLGHITWFRGLSIHTAAAVLLAYLRITAIALLRVTEIRWFDIPPEVYAKQTISAYYSSELFTTYFIWYWAVVGLFHTFEYHRRAEERLKTAAQLRSQLAEAKLQALRSQLNPHFLFNTLNAISVFALKGERTAVVEMTERLSHLLRLVLDDSRAETIPLRRELEFIDEYLDIQRIRFGDGLVIEREIALNTLEALVPPMILQPLVENAVEHGRSTAGATTVAIGAHRSNGVLELRIADSGPGFLLDGPVAGASSLGLRATEERLWVLYGRAQSIGYGRAPAGGATVTITIPFRRTAEAAPSQKYGAADE